MTAALPLAGQWSFGGLDWNFASSTVQRDAIAARFETLQSTALQSPLQQLPDMGADLIEIASMLNVVPEVHEGYRIYRLGQPDLKAELITRDVGGRERAVAAACAYPQTDERWQLFELMPINASHKTTPQLDHLLPLPANAVRRAGRFADDGRLLLEMITLNSNSDDVLKAWQSAGWEVHASGVGDPGAFSFFCARGNDVIYAWSANRPETLKTLMLVRSPTDEELRLLQTIP